MLTDKSKFQRSSLKHPGSRRIKKVFFVLPSSFLQDQALTAVGSTIIYLQDQAPTAPLKNFHQFKIKPQRPLKNFHQFKIKPDGP
ncbi:hypothetical protein ACFX1X_047133 [Malus domestica]